MAITKYTVTFRDIKNRVVVITISNGLTGTTKTLTPASNPLTTSEDDDRDPMLPIRTTTAQIRVLCTYSEIIPVKTNREWSVEVKRANVVLWRGYLRAEAPDADFSPIPSEISYTADDILSALSTEEMNFSLLSNLPTLKNLLNNNFTGVNIVRIDNSMPVLQTGAAIISTLPGLYVEKLNWMSDDEDEEPATCDVVERDIVQFLGMTIRYWKNNFYLGSLFGKRYIYDGTIHVPDPLDGEQFEWTGFHTLLQEQGVGKIEVTAVGRKPESMNTPGLDDEYFDISETGWMPPQTAYRPTEGDYNCYYRLLNPIKCWSTVRTGGEECLWNSYGAYITDFDIWYASASHVNINFGRHIFFRPSVYDEQTGTGHYPTFKVTKGLGHLDECITECDALLRAWLANEQPCITLETESDMFVKGGGLTLEVETKKVVYNTVTISGVDYIIPVDTTTDGFGGIFSLQFGSYYWTGTQWVTTKSYFVVNVDTVKTKDITMNFNGTGWAMPTDGYMSGRVKLCFYGNYRRYARNEGSPTVQAICELIPYDYFLRFEKFELSYNPPLDMFEVSKADENKLAYTDIVFPKENSDSVQLSLCSGDKVKQNYGTVYKYNSSSRTILETLHWPLLASATDKSPEELVLLRQRLSKSCARNFAELNMECEYDDMPFQRISLAGRTWYPQAIKTDWFKCSSEVLMLDITDIMASPELLTTGDDEMDDYVTMRVEYQSLAGLTWLRLSKVIDERVTIQWAAGGNSGTAYIAACGDATYISAAVRSASDWTTPPVITTPSGRYIFTLTY